MLKLIAGVVFFLLIVNYISDSYRATEKPISETWVQKPIEIKNTSNDFKAVSELNRSNFTVNPSKASRNTIQTPIFSKNITLSSSSSGSNITLYLEANQSYIGLGAKLFCNSTYFDPIVINSTNINTTLRYFESTCNQSEKAYIMDGNFKKLIIIPLVGRYWRLNES